MEKQKDIIIKNIGLALSLLFVVQACGGGGSEGSSQPPSKTAENIGTGNEQVGQDALAGSPPTDTSTSPSSENPSSSGDNVTNNAPPADLTPAPDNTSTSSNSSELPPLDSTATYLPFKEGLNVVNSLDPTKIVEVSKDGVMQTQLIVTYDYNPELRQATNMRPAMLLYTQNDRLWKIYLEGKSPLTPMQVSNAAGFDSACGTNSSSSADVDATFFFYTLPGQDQECGTEDDRHFFVQARMSPSEAATEITGKIDTLMHIDAIMDIKDVKESISGFIAVKDKSLIHYDVRFENAVQIAAAVNGIGIISGDHHGSGNGVFVSIDQAVYWYDAVTKTLSKSPVLTLTEAQEIHSDWVCDATTCFFTVNNGLAHTIYRVPADGSGPASEITSDLPGMIEGSPLVLTASSILYLGRTVDQSGTPVVTLNQVAKKGGDGVVLDSAEDISGLVWMSGENYFYYTKGGLGLDSVAVVRDSNGAIVKEFAKSRWIGNAFTQMSYLTPGADRVILANGYADKISGLAGATVEVYDVPSNTKLQTVGTIPADIAYLNFFAFGESIIGIGSTKDNKNSDVFYINLAKPNSLHRITDTPDLVEEVIQ